MTPAEYQRAAQLFDQLREQLRDLPATARDSALTAACDGNNALREQVERLLNADRAAEAASFLAQPAIADAARLITPGVLSSGARLGPYEISGPIGAGGMGEVYRARDTQLQREVAIKVLPATLARDQQYMVRFEREAQVLASLNHPNIATVYGIEQGALVMEFIDGSDLNGPLPVDETISIARQIARGLEAAHESGVVHRDLKPANIKITPAGVVKLLDFGLAKPGAEPSAAPASAAVSPTFSPAMTQAGLILGTAAYMSPEQARGKSVDKRSDIWAFGVVLFETLTGSRPFIGETIADTLAAVVKDTPDLTKLPADTPTNLRRLIARCLRKDVNTRLRDIGEARVILDELLDAPNEPPPQKPSRWLPWSFASAAALAAIAFAALWLRHPTPAHALKLALLPPDKLAFSAISLPSISPDGRHVAFAAGVDGKARLWLRDLDSLNARVLAGTDGAFDPFWSPDSRYVAFFVAGKLKKVDLAGGPAVTVCDAGDGRGGTWNQNDVILFAPTFGSQLFRVAAAGGAATPVTELDERAGETSHRFPWFLPDGRHFLFTARAGVPEKSAVFLGDLETKQRSPLINAASNAVFASPGSLLFMRERTLMAQPFDASTLRASGEPSPIAEQVDYLPGNIQGQFAASQSGVLVYYSGGGSLRSQLTWTDRTGKALGKVGPPGTMQAPAISPNGEAVLVDRLDASLGTYDVWVHDLARATDSRLTLDGSNDMFPLWSPDGSRVLFSSNRNGKYGVYQKAANGAGQGDLLYEGNGLTLATDWSSERSIVFVNSTAKTGNDLWVLNADDRKAAPFLQSDSSESHGRLSPDGRWLAYESNETGVAKIYVQAFPGKESKWQISTEAGTRPAWRRDGKELFYIAGDNQMMSVDVAAAGARLSYGVAKPLFETRTAPTALYDVTRDGKRFLMLTAAGEEPIAPMTVVTR